MRKDALFIGLLVGIGLLKGVYADDAGMPACPACRGVSQETPNQRRQRLGQPIQDSFPAPDYGEKLETPNQKRKRLGLPMAAATPAAVSGVSEETPNQKRQRLATEASLASR